MNKNIVCTAAFAALLTSSAAQAAANVNTITKEELAKEVANCYVAHQRFKTDFYLEGKAEVYKELVALLAGQENLNKAMRNAKARQVGPGFWGNSRPAKLEAKKYCTQIDEKLSQVYVSTIK